MPGRTLIWVICIYCYKVTLTWADSGYTGTLTDHATALGITVIIVAKLAGQIGCQRLPRRGAVERTSS
jgi:putative transposase